MLKQVCGTLDEADWAILGLGSIVGILWSVMALLLGYDWWPNLSSPPAERLLPTLLMWPVVAAAVTSRTLLDFQGFLGLTFGYGLLSGLSGSALLVRSLRRVA